MIAFSSRAFSLILGFALLICAVLFSLPSFAQPTAKKVSANVIYGEDGRQDIFQLESSSLREIADSTAAMLRNIDIQNNPDGTVKLVGKSLGEEFELCQGEPFYEQPTAASCSASLVGEDLIATAAHCINETSCKDHSFVFNYRMQDEKTLPLSIAKDEVYACKEIVARQFSFQQDFALVRLERPVRGHRVLNLAQEPVAIKEPIYVIGHPSGLPTKFAGGAEVRSQERGFFITNLDTFGGNSGSAVFSAITNQIVGILVRGEKDYVKDPVRQCTVSHTCENDACRGEDVTDISFIVEALRKIK